MRDFMNTVIKTGDKCIILQCAKTSSWFTKGVVRGFTEFYVRTNIGLFHPDKLIVINDDFYNRVPDKRKCAAEIREAEEYRAENKEAE